MLFLVLVLCVLPFRNCLPFLCPEKLTHDDLNCSIAVGNFRESQPPKKNHATLKIVNFNMDRNGGIDSTRMNFFEIIKKLSRKDFLFSLADVLIITELSRDCKIYAEYTDGPMEIARSLGLSYAYVVEYVENYKEGNEHQCTIGNAIFSKFTLNNIEQIRFDSQCCKYADIRWGGRVAVAADIIFNTRVLTVYSTHLESGQDYFTSVIHGMLVRWWQSKELVFHSNVKRNNSDYVMIAGDLNAPLGIFDLVNFPLIWDGFDDSHFPIRFWKRATCPVGDFEKYGLFIFDYIWMKGDFEFKNEIVCNRKLDENCYGLSDHYPIGVDLTLF